MSRYDLTDFKWHVIEPLLPNKPRGVPRVDDRRVLNGISWVFRSGAPWRDLPERYGPRTTCYNRFVRWRKAGVWDYRERNLVERFFSKLKHSAVSPPVTTSSLRTSSRWSNSPQCACGSAFMSRRPKTRQAAFGGFVTICFPQDAGYYASISSDSFPRIIIIASAASASSLIFIGHALSTSSSSVTF